MTRFLVTKAPQAILRLAGALAVYAALRAVPWPLGMAHWMALGSAAALATAVLLICGTLLYDTFYPDLSQHQMHQDAFWPRPRR